MILTPEQRQQFRNELQFLLHEKLVQLSTPESRTLMVNNFLIEFDKVPTSELLKKDFLNLHNTIHVPVLAVLKKITNESGQKPS